MSDFHVIQCYASANHHECSSCPYSSYFRWQFRFEKSFCSSPGWACQVSRTGHRGAPKSVPSFRKLCAYPRSSGERHKSKALTTFTRILFPLVLLTRSRFTLSQPVSHFTMSSAALSASSAAVALLPDVVTRARSVATIVESRAQPEGDGKRCWSGFFAAWLRTGRESTASLPVFAAAFTLTLMFECDVLSLFRRACVSLHRQRASPKL